MGGFKLGVFLLNHIELFGVVARVLVELGDFVFLRSFEFGVYEAATVRDFLIDEFYLMILGGGGSVNRFG